MTDRPIMRSDMAIPILDLQVVDESDNGTARFDAKDRDGRWHAVDRVSAHVWNWTEAA